MRAGAATDLVHLEAVAGDLTQAQTEGVSPLFMPTKGPIKLIIDTDPGIGECRKCFLAARNVRNQLNISFGMSQMTPWPSWPPSTLQKSK